MDKIKVRFYVRREDVPTLMTVAIPNSTTQSLFEGKFVVEFELNHPDEVIGLMRALSGVNLLTS